MGEGVKASVAVVGAVIVDRGLILCAKRPDHGRIAGLWEFPGGKIEPHETPQESLVREIREEMRCEIAVGEIVTTSRVEDRLGIVTLTTYRCQLLSGTPQLTEHVAIRWLAPRDLPSLRWAPADQPAVDLLVAEATVAGRPVD